MLEIVAPLFVAVATHMLLVRYGPNSHCASQMVVDKYEHEFVVIGDIMYELEQYI